MSSSPGLSDGHVSRPEAFAGARTPGFGPDPLSKAVSKSLSLDGPPFYSGVGLKAQRPPAAPSFCSYFMKRQRESERAADAQQWHEASVRGTTQTACRA